MTRLRPYQETAVAAVQQAWANGKHRPVLVAGTGAGKTEMAAALLATARSPAAIVHTSVLFEQTARRIPNARVYTVQALIAKGPAGDRRRAALARHDMFFADECFTLQTIVRSVGNVVVVSTRSAPDRLIEIDGVTSTPDHPYLTSKGWKRAEDIAIGDMCCVRVSDSRCPATTETPEDLLPRVSLEEIQRDHGAHQQAARLCKANRTREHDAQARSESQALRYAESERAQAVGAGRERPWAHVYGATVGSSDGTYAAESDHEGRRAAASLQVGSSVRIGEAGNRGGWAESSGTEGAGSRPTQGSALGWQGVARVEVHERGGRGRYDEVCPDGRVYNLQTDSGVYFAGDYLVHNCHHLGAGEWSQVVPFLAHARVFGCTATPMRSDGSSLGDVFDHMVVAANYPELVRDGYLVKCDVSRSDIRRAAQKKNKVRPDGVAAYLEQGRRADGTWRPNIHFEVTIEACQSAAQRYNEAGVRAAVIDCNTSAAERGKLFAQYDAGLLDSLCSPTALAEGFNSCRAECCVLRRSVDHVGDFLQRVGRVLRPFPGKERALLIDICNATEKHGMPTDARAYSLDGKGIRLQAEVDEEEEETEPLPPPSPWQIVESRYALIRDTLLSRYRALQEEATERGYKSGWIFHRFTEATSIPPPRMFPAKFRSVCIHCRKRLEIGETMFWLGTSQVFHEECWIASLDGEKLEAASIALESATAWKPSRTKQPTKPSPYASGYQPVREEDPF